MARPLKDANNARVVSVNIRIKEDFLVGAAGFEPATLCSQGRCATKLRYAPTYFGTGLPIAGQFFIASQ